MMLWFKLRKEVSMDFQSKDLVTNLAFKYVELEDRIFEIERPKLYGQYLISLSLAEEVNNWYKYFDHKDEIQSLLGVKGLLSGSKHLLTLYCFLNDCILLEKLLDFALEREIIIQSVKIVSDRYRNIILKRNKYEPKGPWFGTFNYRVRLNRPYNFYKKEFKNILPNMTGKLITSYNNPSLIYMDVLNDVLLLKLIMNKEIIEIYDYSVVRP